MKKPLKKVGIRVRKKLGKVKDLLDQQEQAEVTEEDMKQVDDIVYKNLAWALTDMLEDPADKDDRLYHEEQDHIAIKRGNK